jgi:hypothetical protein
MAQETEWTIFEAQVSAGDGRPFVKMTCGLGDTPVFSTQLPPSVCTAMGLRAVQAAIEAERDAGLVAFLMDDFGPRSGMHGGDAQRLAAVMLDGLRRHRAQFDAAAGSTSRPLGPDDPSKLEGAE